MASSKLSLFYSLTLLVLLPFLLASVNANSINNHARMIKKRQTNSNSVVATSSAGPLGIINPIGNPNAQSATEQTPGATSDPTANVGKPGTNTDTAANAKPTGPTKGTTQTSSDGGLLGTILSGVLGGDDSTSADATGTETSLPAGQNNATETTSGTTTTGTTTTSSQASQTQSPPVEPSEVHVTANAQVTTTAASAQQSDSTANLGSNSGAKSDDGGHVGRNTIIVIASIGGGIGLIVLLWTVFRKMKLGTSKEFDDRLNPIDWQPTNSDADAAPPMNQIRRTNSIGSQRSFNSQMNPNYGAAQRSMISDIPNHDFTAGPTGLAPGGYADLRRGPSPVPSEAASMRRGPSPYGGGPYGGYGGY